MLMQQQYNDFKFSILEDESRNQSLQTQILAKIEFRTITIPKLAL